MKCPLAPLALKKNTISIIVVCIRKSFKCVNHENGENSKHGYKH